VHSFTQELKIAYIFLAFMGSILAACTVLIVYRLPKLRSENTIESFVSRESAFLFNNLILLGAAFAVMWGTLFPLIAEGVTGEKVSVGPAFFQRVNFPIGLVLLALSGIGPIIAWRRATRRNLKRNFSKPLVGSFLAAAVLWALGARHPLALTTWTIGVFVLATIGTEFWKGTRARAHIEGEGWFPALYHLVTRNRRRWGGYIVHVGMVMLFMAFAGAAYNQDVRKHMLPGESVEVASPFGHAYTLTYEGLSVSLGNGQRNLAWQAIALFQVYKGDKPLGTMTTEKRMYVTGDQAITEVGIRVAAYEDLYLILAALDDPDAALNNSPDAQGIDLQVLVKPLVLWIWLGGLTLAIGSLISLWPSVEQRRVAETTTSVEEPVPVGAV
jgi:cytochrome c-type biogenesis protein CcmF